MKLWASTTVDMHKTMHPLFLSGSPAAVTVGTNAREVAGSNTAFTVYSRDVHTVNGGDRTPSPDTPLATTCNIRYGRRSTACPCTSPGPIALDEFTKHISQAQQPAVSGVSCPQLIHTCGNGHFSGFEVFHKACPMSRHAFEGGIPAPSNQLD